MFGTLSMARGSALTMDTQELCGVLTVTVSFIKTLAALCSLDVVLFDVVATFVLPGASLTPPVSGDTKNVLTGSADNSCRLWDCETGRCHRAALLHLTFFPYTVLFKIVSIFIF